MRGAPARALRACLGLLCVAAPARAVQPRPHPEPLRLKGALEEALRSYGEVRAVGAELAAADEQLTLAKRAYLPDVDLYFQWNRATRNNVFGLLLPGGDLPAISGPVVEATSHSTYGSVAAALLRWEAVDFGERAAGVRQARAVRRGSEAARRATQLQVALGTADAFLGVVAAEAGVRAAQAAASRMEVFAGAVHALTENELRPGADLSLARAELARARTELARAEQTLGEAGVSLAEWLGRDAERVEVDGAELLAATPGPASAALAADDRPPPLVERAAAAHEEARARRDAAARAHLPKLELLAALYARGSGASIDGSFDGGRAGLAPETDNWAVGVAVRVPLMDLAARRRTALEEYRMRAASARYDDAVRRASAELARARIREQAALKVAENTPLQLEAARALELQARARYDAGLADALAVAEAERLLRRAETENALARLDVWRARFALAAAAGDLVPVLDRLD